MVVVVVLMLVSVGYPSRTTLLPLVVCLQTRGPEQRQDLEACPLLVLLNCSEPNGCLQIPQQVVCHSRGLALA